MHGSSRQGTNLQSVKWQNRAVVLETLWRFQPLSRRDLARRTDLTPATLTNIVAEFLDAGIVEETGFGEQRTGRRPTMLAFVPACYYLLGVNLSRTEISIGLFDLRLNAQHVLVHPITERIGGGPVDTLLHLIRQTVAGSGLGWERIIAIGISAPGPLSGQEGMIYAPPHFSDWSYLPLGPLVQQAFDRPVWLENDANANALAEHWLGAGRAYSNFVYVENHSGLGSGIVLNGRLFTGSTGVAAEVGHTSIDRHGPRCPCGNYGCVEMYASGPAIMERVRQAHAAGRHTLLTDWLGDALDGLTFDHVIEASYHDDQLSIEVLCEACRALGQGLVNTINLVDPEAIVLGHKLHRFRDDCLESLREVIRQQAIPQAAARLNIVVTQLPEPAGVTGAACRALSGLLQDPHLLLERTPSTG
ncbi:MAG: ROK family transcriptional regulator [Anaerolineae bacterium]